LDMSEEMKEFMFMWNTFKKSRDAPSQIQVRDEVNLFISRYCQKFFFFLEIFIFLI